MSANDEEWGASIIASSQTPAFRCISSKIIEVLRRAVEAALINGTCCDKKKLNNYYGYPQIGIPKSVTKC